MARFRVPRCETDWLTRAWSRRRRRRAAAHAQALEGAGDSGSFNSKDKRYGRPDRRSRGVVQRSWYSHRLELWHGDLKKHRVIKGNEPTIVERKATLQAEEWKEKWASAQRRETQKRERQKKKDYIEAQKETAAERSAEAAAELESLNQLLAHTLTVDDAIDWERLKDHSDFPEPRPTPESKPGVTPPASLPPEPLPSSPAYQPHLSLLDRLIRSRRERKNAEAAQRYDTARASWTSEVKAAEIETRRRLKEHQADLDRIDREHAEATKRWEEQRSRFVEEQRQGNEAVDRKKALYESKDPNAVAK